jgi:tetratricopeptide (TPR) repeat protein
MIKLSTLTIVIPNEVRNLVKFKYKSIMRFLTSFGMTIVFLFFTQESFAKDYVSTSDVIKEIEKTLLFDKESSEKINFYRGGRSSKKSSMTISEGNPSDDSSAQKKSEVDILVVDPKFDKFNVREKEKLAYNISLVGQDEVAIELYKQVIKSEPENVYAKFSLAVLYQKLNQLGQAKNLYYDLLKDDPSNKEEIVGNILAILIEESPRDAIYLLSRLSVQNPQSSYILAQTANAYDRMKSYDQAVNFLKKAIKIDGDNVDYKYNLAVIYDKTSQFEKALELYVDVAKNYANDNDSVSLEQIENRINAIKSKI